MMSTGQCKSVVSKLHFFWQRQFQVESIAFIKAVEERNKKMRKQPLKLPTGMGRSSRQLSSFMHGEVQIGLSHRLKAACFREHHAFPSRTESVFIYKWIWWKRVCCTRARLPMTVPGMYSISFKTPQNVSRMV